MRQTEHYGLTSAGGLGKGMKPPAATRRASSRRLLHRTVLSAAKVEQHLKNIATTTQTGQRDQTMIAVMIYYIDRPKSVRRLMAVDYKRSGAERPLRQHPGDANANSVPVPAEVAACLDPYLEAAGTAEDDGPLFRSIRPATGPRNGPATGWNLVRTIRKRVTAACLARTLARDRLRATGLAMVLADGGSIEQAKAMTGCGTDHPQQCQ
jgi:hypothetical protein